MGLEDTDFPFWLVFIFAALRAFVALIANVNKQG